MIETFHCLYEALQAEDAEVALVIVREAAKSDVPTEKAFHEWGECQCCPCWDAMLARAGEVLHEFVSEDVNGRIVEGRIFKVALPELEKVLP